MKPSAVVHVTPEVILEFQECLDRNRMSVPMFEVLINGNFSFIDEAINQAERDQDEEALKLSVFISKCSPTQRIKILKRIK